MVNDNYGTWTSLKAVLAPLKSSVPDPEDPLHFGPLRSGSNIIYFGSGSGSGSGSSSIFSTSIRSIIILHIKLVLLLLLV